MDALHRAAGEVDYVDFSDSYSDDDLAAVQAWLDKGADPYGAAGWRAAFAAKYAAHAAYCVAATALYGCRAWRGEFRDRSEDRASLRSRAWTCAGKTAQSAWCAATAWSEDVDAAYVAGWLVGECRDEEKAEAETAESERAYAAACRPAKVVQANLLRDIFGNPFCPPPVLAPAVLAGNGGAARRLAEAIYEGPRFNELGVLADLLEETGCTDVDLLEHLRGPGPHTRGCWALDLILSKDR
jgi:hypothetical protein